MNEYDLFDAFGGIDEELLSRSERKAVRKFPIRKALIAAAAVMLLAVTAIATPVVREFLSAKGSELTGGGFYITLEKLGIINQYVEPQYEIELKVPASPNVPEYIQDFRVPTYFVENGWIMDHVEMSSSTNPDSMTALYFLPDNPVPQVFFQQHIFYPSDDPEVLQYSFSQKGMQDGKLTEESITVGKYEASVYNGNTIIWTDGQYAYELIFHCGTTPNEIEAAALSMKSVDLMAQEHTVLEDQLTDRHKTPIETFYTLSKLPDGFTFVNRGWDVNNAWENYMLDSWHHITFAQCVNASPENLGPCFSIEDEMLGRALDQKVFTTEEYTIDGVDVTIFRSEDGTPKLMWYLDNYCFDLWFSYNPGLTDKELLDYYRSVQPMPDFTDHLTK